MTVPARIGGAVLTGVPNTDKGSFTLAGATLGAAQPPELVAPIFAAWNRFEAALGRKSW